MSRRVAPLVLALVLASVWAAADSRADALEEPPELVGVWKLERREDLEEYLKASGTPWWKRKLALLGSSRLRQTIASRSTARTPSRRGRSSSSPTA